MATLPPDAAFDFDGDPCFKVREVEPPFPRRVELVFFAKGLAFDFFPKENKFKFQLASVPHRVCAYPALGRFLQDQGVTFFKNLDVEVAQYPALLFGKILNFVS